MESHLDPVCLTMLENLSWAVILLRERKCPQVHAMISKLEKATAGRTDPLAITVRLRLLYHKQVFANEERNLTDVIAVCREGFELADRAEKVAEYYLFAVSLAKALFQEGDAIEGFRIAEKTVHKAVSDKPEEPYRSMMVQLLAQWAHEIPGNAGGRLATGALADYAETFHAIPRSVFQERWDSGPEEAIASLVGPTSMKRDHQ